MRFAKHVHIVHTGECPDCTHVFDVDGAEFPWYITEAGPRVRRLMDEFYAVHVEIFCVDKDTKVISFETTGVGCHVPVIAGIEFPWYLTENGFTFRNTLKSFPTVALSFLSSRVDVEGIPIIDARTSDVAVRR